MKNFKIKSLLFPLIIVGLIISVGYGFRKPTAVLSVQDNGNSVINTTNFYRRNSIKQRYWWPLRPYPGTMGEASKPNSNEAEDSKKPAGLSYEQSKMLELVNEDRVKAGVPPLESDLELANVAYIKAKDMADNNYFSHNSPTYGSPFVMMRDFGIKYSAAGENLAGYNNVEKAHVGLMNSDGHRKNILNPNFTHIGIGVHKSSRYGYVFVQMFIRK